MPQYFQRANYIEGGVAPRDAPSIAIPTQNPALQAKESLYKTIDQRVAEAAAIFNKQAAMKAKVVGEAAGASHATQELTLDVIEAAASANEPITITGDPSGNILQRAAYKGSMAVLASNYDAAMRGEITTALIEATQNPNSNPSNLQETVSNIVDSYVGALTTISPVTASKIGKSGAIYAQATVKSFSMGWMTRDIKKRLNDAKAKARDKLYQLPVLIGQHEVGQLAATIRGAYENVINDLELAGAQDSYIQSFTRNWEKKVLESKLAAVEQWSEMIFPGKGSRGLSHIHKFLKNETGHLVPKRVQEVIKSLSVEDHPKLRKNFNQLISNQLRADGQIDKEQSEQTKKLVSSVLSEYTTALREKKPPEDLQKIINKLDGIADPKAAQVYKALSLSNLKGETVISDPAHLNDLNIQQGRGTLGIQAILSAKLSTSDRKGFLTALKIQETAEGKNELEKLKTKFQPIDPEITSRFKYAREKIRQTATYNRIVAEFYQEVGVLEAQNDKHTTNKEYNKIKDIDYPGIMNKIEKRVLISTYTTQIETKKSSTEKSIRKWKKRTLRKLTDEHRGIANLFEMITAVSSSPSYGDNIINQAERFEVLINQINELQEKLDNLRQNTNE